ncbi:hypothetical protein SAMN00120144_1877 [Hymenobacter roseosalivarius DSM 11622]|uniref:Uncharacterized protein n=1 Tax=Hymenobacter roseosalivarius DSM 11622 TaxID=645990 RepID=A0A1W1VP77_9BACT|nr:hypothetical protein SAMN00120144_1877 [Hymenobacter roseosalivarius DSM 11622]
MVANSFQFIGPPLIVLSLGFFRVYITIDFYNQVVLTAKKVYDK